MKRYKPILLLLFSLFWVALPARSGLTLQPFTLLPGQTADVAVTMDSSDVYTALMFDITFPDEVRLKAVSKGTAATSSHSVTFSTLPNGDSRVVAFSSSNDAFMPSGSLIVLEIEDGDKAEGIDSIFIHDIVLTGSDGNDSECADSHGPFTAALHGSSATAPVISLNGHTVSIDAGGNPCYYTIDGTEPSRFGTQYTAPFTVSRNCTIRAIATEANKDKSATSMLVINTFQVVKPVITMQHDTCTISCTDAEAVIRYTLDGSSPSSSGGIQYSLPFKVQGNCTIKASASKENFNTSDIASYAVNIFTASTPEINFSNKTVTLTTATEGAAIHYTLDGTVPTEASTLYAQPFTLTKDTRVKAIATKPAYNQSQVADSMLTMQTVSIASFSVKPGQKVKIAVSCSMATEVTALMFDVVFPDELRIIKAEKGEGATSSHAVSYSDLGSGRFRTVAFSSQNENFISDSNILYLTIEGGDMQEGTANFSIENLTVTTATGHDVESFSSNSSYQASKNGVQAAMPTLSVSNALLTISSQGDSCYYTLDGSEPSRFGTLYTEPVLLTSNCTVKAIAAAAGKDKSATASLEATPFVVSKPVISWDNNVCTITCDMPESSIFYTIDGSDATADAAIAYSHPFTIPGNVTVQACAKRDGYTTSAISTLVIDTFTVATPVIEFHNDTMTLSTATAGASLYYTTDGSKPTQNSVTYTKPVVLAGNVPVRAIAKKEYYNDSKEAHKQMDWFKVATPVITMIDDSVFSITTATPGAIIYYTTDGSEPTTASSVYTKPLKSLKDCTVKAFATKSLYKNSDTLTQKVVIILDMVTINGLQLAGEETGSLILSMTNRTPFTAMMLDMHLPDGLRMVPDTTLTGLRLTPSHSITCQETSPGVYRVVIFSSDNTPFNDNSGELFIMPVYAVNSVPSGTYDIVCDNIIATTADGKDKELTQCQSSFVMNPYSKTVATPVISANGQHVTISCTSSNAEIHYTLDGTYPTSQSPVYSAPFTIDRNLTIKAIGIVDGWNQSAAAIYNVSNLKVATPVLFLTDGKTVTLDCATENVSIYYSRNNGQFQPYTGHFTLTANATVKAVACRDGWLCSDTIKRYIGSVDKPYIELSNAICAKEEESTLNIYLHGGNATAAYQFDIVLPDDVSLIDSSLTLGPRKGASHSLATAYQADGSLRVLCFSAQNDTLPSGNEALLSFKVTAPYEAQTGYYDTYLKNIYLTSISGEESYFDDSHAVISVVNSLKKYSLTYVVDGAVYHTDSLMSHDKIEPPLPPVKEGHTFSGWTGIPATMPAHNDTINGYFYVNSYLLTYILDNEQYASDSVAYGTSLTPIEAPVKEGYTFSGWSEIPATMPAHDVNITGSFSINSYILTYLVDGLPYQNDTVVYNSVPVPLAEPVKEGHTFSGWDGLPSVMPAHNDTVNGYFYVNSYLLTYILDNEQYASDSVAYGTSLTPIEAPVKEGYTFSGWSEIPATMPAHDVTVTGSFSINSYILTYLVDGLPYQNDTVVYNSVPVPLAEPVKEGHTFSGWNGLPSVMPAHNDTVNGYFYVNSYLLTYILDNEQYTSDSVAFGTPLTHIEAPVKEGYTFSGWSEMPATMPAHDVTVTGSFSINSYILTYMVDGLPYQNDSVVYNTIPVPPAEPVKEGHTFSGWNGLPSVMPAHNDTVNGYFYVNSYLLTYILDNEQYTSDSVAFGTPLAHIKAPVKEGYTFSGWSEIPATMPAHDVTITGSFSINSYILTYFVDEDFLTTEQYCYGDTIHLIETLQREGCTFSGWDVTDVLMPAHDITANGHFIPNVYLLTYFIDGDFFLSDSIAYGSAIPAIDHPVLEGYYFSDWVDMPDMMPAHDVTVNGSFIIKSYTLTYIIDDETYSVQNVAYHDSIVPMECPFRTGHTFSGWQGEPVIMPAHDVTVNGTFISGNISATMPEAPFDVYNLQGFLILRHADKKDLLSLPPGLYIANGKVVMINK